MQSTSLPGHNKPPPAHPKPIRCGAHRRPRTQMCPVSQSIQRADEAPGQPGSGRSKPPQGLPPQTRRRCPPGGQQREGRPKGPPTIQNQWATIAQESDGGANPQCLRVSVATDQQKWPQTADRSNLPLRQPQCLRQAPQGPKKVSAPMPTQSVAREDRKKRGTAGTLPRGSSSEQRPMRRH